MNIIDFHAHIFPDALAERAIAKLLACAPDMMNFTDGTSSGLLHSMKKYGVTQSVLLPVATKPSQVRNINEDALLMFTSAYIPFGALHPKTENFQEEIAFLKNNRIKGVKFHPEYQDFYADSPSMYPLYDALSDANLITVFHAGKDPGPFTCDHCLPAALKKIHHDFPKLIIVAAHMGGWGVWNYVEELLCGTSVYFDTAAVSGAIPDGQFIKIVKKHGIENILFGTDSPWFDQGKSIKWIDQMRLSDAEKEAIFFKNALNLLDL